MKRASLFLASPLLFVFAACSSSQSGDDVGPAPTDPVTFEASADTTKDTGIAKWGYDDSTGAQVFHGYDAKNAQLVEVRETFEQVDETKQRISITMTGRIGTASSTVELGTVVNPDFSVSYTRDVLQNSFDALETQKVLAHLVPDSVAMANKPTDPARLLKTKSIKPKDSPVSDQQSNLTGDGGAPLVGEQSELLECCCELQSSNAALGAEAAAACALTSSTQSNVINPEELVRQNGHLTVRSPWNGPYNIVDHHCHNAAAQNASKTDGYIGCNGQSSTTTYGGHTINWAPNPYQSVNNYCMYEPQLNGGLISNGAICCFGDKKNADGSPSLSSNDARSCLNKLCGADQLDYDGKKGLGTPQAFPAGSTPPLPTNCSTAKNTLTDCNSCCTTQADDTAKRFPQAEFTAQIASYRASCARACQNAETVRKPPPPTSDPSACAAATLRLQQSQLDRSSKCGDTSNQADGGTGGSGK